MRKFSLVTIFALAGFLGGELYMIYTVLAPVFHGEEFFVTALRTSTLPITLYAPTLHAAPASWATIIKKLLAMALFFGPFGAAAGTGIGLLAQGLVNVFRGTPKPTESTEG